MNQTRPTKRDALAASVFGQLSPSQLDQIAGISDERHVDTGAALCREGEFGSETFVIASGEVAVEVGGRRMSLAGPGAVLGDWAMFKGGRRSATLRAVTAVAAVVVDAPDVDALLAAVPAAARHIGPSAIHQRPISG